MFDFDVRSGSHAQENTSVAHPGRGLASAPHELRGHELAVPVSVIPRRPPLTVSPTFTLRQAFRLMSDRHASVALVAAHGVLLGVLSERDVVHRLLDQTAGIGELPVSEVMVSEVETLLESDTVAYAFRKMWSLGGRAMPVVRSNGSVHGVLETQDLVAWVCGRVGARPQTLTSPF